MAAPTSPDDARKRLESELYDERGFLLPHHRTFSGIVNTMSRIHSFRFDEAMRHAPQNAVAMRHDAYFGALIDERTTPLMHWQWQVELDADDKALQDGKEQERETYRRHLEAIIRRTYAFDHMREYLREFVWVGKQGAQVVWGDAVVGGQKRKIITAHAPVDGDKILTDFDGAPAVAIYGGDVSNYPEEAIGYRTGSRQVGGVSYSDRFPVLRLNRPDWRQRFIIPIFRMRDGDYFDPYSAGRVGGIGLRHYAYWAWWLRDEMLAWATDFMEKVGSLGIMIFFYEEHNVEGKTRAVAAARQVGNGNALAVPVPRGDSRAGSVELIPANLAGVQFLTDFIGNYFEGHLERLIVGQKLSADHTGSGGLGGSGAAGFAQDTKYNLLAGDAKLMSWGLTQDLLKPAIQLNFPGLPWNYEFKLIVPKPDTDKKLNAVQTAWGLGVDFVEDEVRELTGMSKPQQGERTLRQIADEQKQQDQARDIQRSVLWNHPAALQNAPELVAAMLHLGDNPQAMNNLANLANDPNKLKEVIGSAPGGPPQQDQPEPAEDGDESGSAPEMDQAGATYAYEWTPSTTRSGKIKAVGVGEHAGRTLYGKAAEDALNQKGGPAQEDQPGAKKAVAAAEPEEDHHAAAIRIVRNAERATPEDLAKLAKSLPKLTSKQIRVLSHGLIDQASNGGRMVHGAIVDHLVNWAKQVSLGSQPATEKAAAGPTESTQSVGPERQWRAGSNVGSVKFASEDQQKLHDIGADDAYRMRGGQNKTSQRAAKDTSGDIEDLAKRHRKTPDEIRTLARSVHGDVKEQMKGLRDGESRAVKDNHGIGTAAKSPASPEPKQPAAESQSDDGRHEVYDRFADVLHNHSPHLRPGQRAHYQRSIEKTLSAMPAAAHDLIAKHTHEIKFHEEPEEIGYATVDALLGSSGDSSPKNRSRLANLLKGLKAGKVKPGAAWLPKQGGIHLDGDLGENYQAHEVYAHSLGHAMDGPDKHISRSDDWKAAWQEEIAGGGLSKYAGNSAHEGFAEFCRLVYGADNKPDDMAAIFPKAAAAMKARNLWPEHSDEPSDEKVTKSDEPAVATSEEAKTAPPMEAAIVSPKSPILPEIFEARVPLDETPDGAHVDAVEYQYPQGKLFDDGETNERLGHLERLAISRGVLPELGIYRHGTDEFREQQLHDAILATSDDDLHGLPDHLPKSLRDFAHSHRGKMEAAEDAKREQEEAQEEADRQKKEASEKGFYRDGETPFAVHPDHVDKAEEVASTLADGIKHAEDRLATEEMTPTQKRKLRKSIEEAKGDHAKMRGGIEKARGKKDAPEIEYESDLQRDLHQLALKMREGGERSGESSGSTSSPAGPRGESEFQQLLTSLKQQTGMSEDAIRELAGKVRDDVAEQAKDAKKGEKVKVKDRHGVAKMAAQPAAEEPPAAGVAAAEPEPEPQPELKPAQHDHPAIEKHAQAMLASAIKKAKADGREAEITPELTQAALERFRNLAQETYASLADKESLYKRWKRGALHPSNKQTRQMFQDVHGVALPATASGTNAAVRAHLGEEFVAGKEAESLAKVEAEEKAKADKKAAESQAKLDKFSGFGADMTPLARATAHKALSRQFKFGADSEAKPLHEHLRDRIDQGATITDHGDQGRRLMMDGGSFLHEGQIGKTAFDFAQHLLNRKNSGDQPNTITTDTSLPAVDDGQLESGSGQGDSGRVSAGQPVGSGVEPVSAGEQPGGGDGERTASLPDGQDASGDGDVRAADGRGDAAGRGVGTGEGRPDAGTAGQRAERVRKPRRVNQNSAVPRDDHGTRLGGGLTGNDPALPEPTPHEESVSEPPEPENPTDLSAGNYRYDSRDFFKSGAKAKFNANLAAIRTMKQMQEEGRTQATPEEQAIISKFTGWGSLPQVFDYRQHDWNKERAALRSVLTDEEMESASRSTLNAHYTHPDIVDLHWKLAERLGYKGGRFLETSAGIGYYLGMMPPHIAARSAVTAVELDKATGSMLQALYPKANVQIQGFQKHQSPDNFYDLIASNVPFGTSKPRDEKYDKHGAHIHDYFFLKSMDKVRPGGLVMHVTSTGTLDKPDPKIRAELAKKADLIGAIRFPGDTHLKNAGTSVVTDMLIFRRRQEGEEPGDQSWLETTTVPDPAGGEPIPVNKYFASNPHMVLGTIDRTGTMYHGESANVSKTDDYEDRLNKAIESIPEGIYKRHRAPASRFTPERLPAPGEVKDGGFHVENGKIYRRSGGEIQEQKGIGKDVAEKITAHMGVRDAFRAVLNAEIRGEDATAARAELNTVYDAFVKKHGFLNAPANRKVFATDPDSPVLLALEKYDSKSKKSSKADIFHKATIRPMKKVDRVENVSEGLGVSLHENGRLDVDHIAQLMGTSREEVGKHLLQQGLAFEDPSDGWQPKDHYLSGNVRRKLAMAQAAAKTDPRYLINVEELKKVQPEDLHHDEIDVKLGAPWVPASDVKDFAASLLQAESHHFDINYIPKTGSWVADFSKDGRHLARGQAANEVWGAAGVPFAGLLESALNNQPVTITKPDPSDTSKRVTDPEATATANAKVQEIKDEFRNWVWSGDERRERLHRYYNDNFNNIRDIKYDGSHQTFPGMNQAVNLYDHQKNFVWQVVTTGKGLGGHEVGTGKTKSMGAAAMELRRLGLAKKPAIICKKANVEGVTKELQDLYPGAKILSTVDKFDAKNRKQTISQMATGDHDMVVMTHDQLDLLGMRPEVEEKFIREELAQAEAAYVEAAEEHGKKHTITKQLEKMKLRLEEKLEDALKSEKKDDAVFFDETGIDHLFVDEAHRYKNLPIYTKLRNLKGIGSSSDRASTMLMKARWLQEQNNGRGVVFMTGTPLSNAISEMYNMQRYIQPKELEERGIHSFDAWASTYCDVSTATEYTATGEYKPVTRLSKYVNVPDLMHISRQMLDVVNADDLKKEDGSPVVVRPKKSEHVVTAEKTPDVMRMMKELQSRAEAIKGKRFTKDNMLAICTDGRKGSIDMRLLYEDAEDDPNSKTNKLVSNVLGIHKGNPGKTQMIFSDIGVNPVANGFHLYGDIMNKLVAGGIPREQIADFSKLEGRAKEEAIEGLNSGAIRVAIGSTEKMGTGVNAQRNLLALHHLDCPHRPADLEQREGRAWRQGNENKNISIHNYVTEGSLDQLFWQTIGRKARTIKQIMKGDMSKRVIAEEDAEEFSPEQVMAAASGDPRILEKAQLDEDVRNLSAAQRRHDRDQYMFKRLLDDGDSDIRRHQNEIENFRNLANTLDQNPEFSLEVGGQTHTDRENAQKAMEEHLAKLPQWGTQPIGSYRGLKLVRGYDGKVHIEREDGGHIPTTGTLASVEAVARRMSSRADEAAQRLDRTKRDLAQIREKHGKPFPKAMELQEKMAKAKLLDAALTAKKDDKADAELAGENG